MNETARILCAISEAETISYRALLNKIGGDYGQTIETVSAFEQQELVTIDRSEHFASIQLTPLGAERAREAQEASR